MADYPKGEGIAFHNDKRQNDRHPEFKGFITLTPDQLRMLVNMVKAGEEPRLQVACWTGTTKAGDPKISIKTEVYSKTVQPGGVSAPQPQRQSAARPAPAPRPAPPLEDDFDDSDIPF